MRTHVWPERKFTRNAVDFTVYEPSENGPAAVGLPLTMKQCRYIASLQKITFALLPK